jgi:hypothetical protein
MSLFEENAPLNWCKLSQELCIGISAGGSYIIASWKGRQCLNSERTTAHSQMEASQVEKVVERDGKVMLGCCPVALLKNRVPLKVQALTPELSSENRATAAESDDRSP